MPFERRYLSFERETVATKAQNAKIGGISSLKLVSVRAAVAVFGLGGAFPGGPFLVCSNGHVSLAVGRERGPESPVIAPMAGPSIAGLQVSFVFVPQPIF